MLLTEQHPKLHVCLGGSVPQLGFGRRQLFLRFGTDGDESGEPHLAVAGYELFLSTFNIELFLLLLQRSSLAELALQPFRGSHVL